MKKAQNLLMLDNIQEYLKELHFTLDLLPREKIIILSEMLFEARKNYKHILICGNGGSAATASHMVTDLSRRQFRAISLNENAPVLTALSNDISYDDVFNCQLPYLSDPGDLLIAISASGNSKNILTVLNAAKDFDVTTIGLLGFDGGKAAEIANFSIIVPSDHYGIVEDIHLTINHMLVNLLDFPDNF